LFSNLSPYNLVNLRHILYLNPWANFILPQSLLKLPHAKVEGNQIKSFDGKSFKEVLNIGENWLNE
ncbi:hypothetical protein NQ911_18900, partial [Acinetobacter baumannii]|nr:hypothetical protein [Acinetobacter baumannii]